MLTLASPISDLPPLLITQEAPSVSDPGHLTLCEDTLRRLPRLLNGAFLRTYPVISDTDHIITTELSAKKEISWEP